jgi:hypothetical protein
MRYHYYAKADRFPYYRGILARFDSVGSCGHDIRKGDRIGWNPRVRKTQCAACWRAWLGENAEADAIEAGNMPNCL